MHFTSISPCHKWYQLPNYSQTSLIRGERFLRQRRGERMNGGCSGPDVSDAWGLPKTPASLLGGFLICLAIQFKIQECSSECALDVKQERCEWVRGNSSTHIQLVSYNMWMVERPRLLVDWHIWHLPSFWYKLGLKIIGETSNSLTQSNVRVRHVRMMLTMHRNPNCFNTQCYWLVYIFEHIDMWGHLDTYSSGHHTHLFLDRIVALSSALHLLKHI